MAECSVISPVQRTVYQSGISFHGSAVYHAIYHTELLLSKKPFTGESGLFKAAVKWCGHTATFSLLKECSFLRSLSDLP